MAHKNSSGGKQWLYWVAAAGLWMCGGAAVLLGEPVIGAALLIGAGGLLLLLSRRRRGARTRDSGSGDRPSAWDMLGP